MVFSLDVTLSLDLIKVCLAPQGTFLAATRELVCLRVACLEIRHRFKCCHIDSQSASGI